MSSPVATIADALMAFILSLLRDPEAAERFNEDPRTAMTESGVQGACMADLRAVKPVIYDHPEVEPRPHTPSVLGSSIENNEVVREIVRIINQFTTVDARSTIVDQSVNQNIWTQGGDVTQLFDQEAVIASGNDAIAAGDDASALDQDLDLTVGDVTAGNDTYTDSFNDADAGVSVPEPSGPPPLSVSAASAPLTTDPAGAGTAAATDPAATDPAAAGSAAPPPAEPVAAGTPDTPASLPEAADYLESDLTATTGESYASESAAVPVDDMQIDAPVEE